MLADEFMRRTAEAKIKKTLKHPFECLVYKRPEQEWTGYRNADVTDLYDISLKAEIEGHTFYVEGTSSYTLESACGWILEILERKFKKFKNLCAGEYPGDGETWLKDQLHSRYKEWHCREHGIKFITFTPLSKTYEELEKIIESKTPFEDKAKKTNLIELPKQQQDAWPF